MSRYGYANRGYSSYNGVPPRANEWSEASYASDDHVCRPVIVDDEGRKMPIVMSIPGVYDYEQRYAAKVERVVEHVRVPVFAQFRKSSSPPKIEPAEDYGYRYSSLPPKVEPEKMYGRYSSPPKKETGKDYGHRMHSSPPKVEPMKDYGYKVDQPRKDYGYKAEPVTDYGYKAAEPVRNYGYKAAEPVKEYGYKAEPMKDYGYKADRPVKDYGYKADQPVKDYGYKAADPVKDYEYKAAEPRKGYGYKAAEPVKEYGYKTEPVKDYNYGGDKWRRPSSPPEDRPQEVEEFITKVQTEASRPNRFPINPANRRQIPVANRNNGDYDDYYRRNDAAMEPSQPTMVTTGGRSQPARDGKLGKPTSDIATAMENLKEAATALSVTTGVPYKRNSIPEIIDSREAARRYSNLNVPSRPETTGETYTPTITSKEAAKKYGGVPV